MSSEKTLTPQIRFKGFTEAWEQRKLGEVFCESTDRSDTLEILSVSVSNGIYPAIESDRIINPGASISNYKVVYPNDVVFNSMRMWQGAVDVSRYKGIVSPAYVVARPLLEVDVRLFSRLLKQPSMLSKYKQISQGNSKDTLTLKYDKFALISIIMPKSIKEQSLISRQFDMLDDLITLHQRKLDALKKIKSALLEKMFPKNGSDIPEIRFTGFTEAWEQRKFLDTFDFLSNNTLSRSQLSDTRGSTLNIHYGDVLIKFGELIDVSKESIPRIANDSIADILSCQKLKNGDVVIADTAEDITVGKCSELRKCENKDIVSGLHTIACRPQLKFASGYLGYYMNSNSFHNQLLPLMQGTKVISISKSAIKNTEISYPNLVEQRLIGKILIASDNLITLHQRKLDALKKIKSALLEKMFV